jgi:hypothetical protein
MVHQHSCTSKVTYILLSNPISSSLMMSFLSLRTSLSSVPPLYMYSHIVSVSKTFEAPYQEVQDTEEAGTGLLDHPFITLKQDAVPKSKMYNGWKLNSCAGECVRKYTTNRTPLNTQAESSHLIPSYTSNTTENLSIATRTVWKFTIRT